MLSDSERQEISQSLLWGHPFRLLNEALRLNYQTYREKADFVIFVLRQRFGIRPDICFHAVFQSTPSGFVYQPGPPVREGETTFQQAGLIWIHPLSEADAVRYMPGCVVKPAPAPSPKASAKKLKGGRIFRKIRG